MSICSMSAEGIEFLIREEGMILKPYRCSANTVTIGVGCTFWEDGRKVQMSDPPISKARALELFRFVLRGFEACVAKNVRTELSQNQFDALVSLCFNIGMGAFAGSSVLRLVNVNPADPAIRDAFLAWRFAAGKPILLARRKREWGEYGRCGKAKIV